MEEPRFRNLYLYHTQFATEIKEAVGKYLVQPGIKRYADGALTRQWLFAITCYLLPFALLLTGTQIWLLAIISGIGSAFLMFSLAQSGAHPGIFRHKWLNHLQLLSAHLLGRSQYYWTIGHTYLHHNYTNVTEFDQGTICFGLIRPYTGAPYGPWHRFQQYYAWLVYALQPLIGFFADFYFIFLYDHYNLPRRKGLHFFDLVNDLLLSKIIYLAIFIGMPIYVAHFSMGITLLIVLIINATGGILTYSTAAACHQFEGSEFLERYHGVLDAEPMTHQLFATRGFAHGNKLLTWLTAGVNFHTEHHLFPELPFMHYPAIAILTEKTAHDHGFKYHYQPTYRQLLLSHYHYLKEMGRKPETDHRYDEQFRGHYFRQKVI